MKVIPFEQAKELTPDEILINETINQEKIGTYTSAVKMGLFLASLGLILTFLFGIMVIGIPNLIYILMGVQL